MKTSNKWLLAAFLVLLGSLTAYNMGLRNEYARGSYKNPLRNSTALAFKGFDEVDLPAATLLNVQVVAGPYEVRVDNEAAKYLKVTQQGSRLTVAVVFPEGREPLGGPRTLRISLPQLRQLQASGRYTQFGKVVTDKEGDRSEVCIQGFRQDSLRLQQDLGARVKLVGNHLGYLQAEAGRALGSHSALRIEKDNRIQAADLSVQHQSSLALEAGGIAKLRTQFGDSARATLAGAGLGNLGAPLAQ